MVETCAALAEGLGTLGSLTPPGTQRPVPLCELNRKCQGGGLCVVRYGALAEPSADSCPLFSGLDFQSCHSLRKPSV